MTISALPLTSSLPPGRPETWLLVLRRYAAFAVPAHLIWEFAHLPLYTIWHDRGTGEIVFAALHCTGGDALIATATLTIALLLAGRGWPVAGRSYWRVAAIAIALGAGYTAYSEWLNTTVRNAWAYTELMPVIPLIDAGLSPILQWLFIPLAAFWWARRSTIGAEQRNEIPA